MADTKKAKNKEQKAVPKTTAGKRRVAPPQYKSFRISKRIKQPKPPIKGAFRLFAASIRILVKNWKLFGGISLVYLVLTILLVKGFGVSGNIEEIREIILEAVQGKSGQFITGITLYGVLLGTANSTNSEVAGAYQSILLLIMSVVLIWALRQSLASKPAIVTVRDAFYKGAYPLIPFLLVLIVIGIQLLPLLIGNFLYGAVIGTGLAVTSIEKALWFMLIGLLSLLSIYLVTSSIFALYIVTLPDTKPLQALRSARDLVLHRRWMIMRKVVFLPVALIVLTGIIIVPLIIVSAPLAEWMFFILSMLTLAVVHSYFYTLYRELL